MSAYICQPPQRHCNKSSNYITDRKLKKKKKFPSYNKFPEMLNQKNITVIQKHMNKRNENK